MIAADALVCIDSTSQHGAALHSSAMTDTHLYLELAPGDCYQTSGGEKVKVKIANPYRVDGKSNGHWGKKHKAGTYKVKAKKYERTVTIRVYK